VRNLREEEEEEEEWLHGVINRLRHTGEPPAAEKGSCEQLSTDCHSYEAESSLGM
jgi:hypothetical protein